ncbi:MAG: hypothetical protein ACJ8C3_20775 [Microvirga sp.]
MNAHRVASLAGALFSFASLSPASASTDLPGYAETMAVEAFFAQPAKSSVSVTFVGPTPSVDRQVVSTFLAPFNWVTGTTARLSGVDDADLVVVHVERFGSLLDAATVDPRIADLVRRNTHHLRAGGPCTKIVATHPDGTLKSFVFLTLEEDEERRKTCLYAQVRSLFGLREAGAGGQFADVFLSDLVVARCIQQVKAGLPSAAASEKKAAVVQRLQDRMCGI